MAVDERRASELRNHADLIWSIADSLRGPYKRSEYGHVILPLTLMRRLDQAMEDTKDAVVAEAEQRRKQGIENLELLLRQVAGRQFFNSSPLRFSQLSNDPRHIATNLSTYIRGYSQHAKAVFENFDFEKQIEKLECHGLLHLVVSRMCEVDLHPDQVSNLEMGYMFEELIRRFAESSNDEAGEHFTPREVVRLMVNLLLASDEQALAGQAPILTVYDCACGTGGMLSEAEAHIKALNPNAVVHLFGQEINEQTYAICLADMLIRGQNPSRIIRGMGERLHSLLRSRAFRSYPVRVRLSKPRRCGRVMQFRRLAVVYPGPRPRGLGRGFRVPMICRAGDSAPAGAPGSLATGSPATGDAGEGDPRSKQPHPTGRGAHPAVGLTHAGAGQGVERAVAPELCPRGWSKGEMDGPSLAATDRKPRSGDHRGPCVPAPRAGDLHGQTGRERERATAARDPAGAAADGDQRRPSPGHAHQPRARRRDRQSHNRPQRR
jgi:hypothetical protein